MSTATHAPIDTATLRAQEFPLAQQWAYLDQASNGPFPQRTVRALEEFARAFAVPHIWGITSREAPFVDARVCAARLAGVVPERVAFTASAGHGISICAAGLDVRPGDEVVIPHSEFPSLAFPFLAQAERGLTVRWAPKNAEGRTDLDIIESLIGPRTRAVAISQIEYADGFRNDLRALGEICRRHGILLIVDATQGLGAAPLDVDGWGVHAAVAHGYKWLHAGFGIAVAAFSEEGIERIRPTHAGSRSVCSDSFVAEPELVWHPGAQRFEAGGLPHTAICVLAASLSLVTEVGPERILAHTHALLDQLVAGAHAKGYAVASSLELAQRGQYIAITGGSREVDERVHVALTEAGVITAVRPKGIRVSPTFYNDATDIDRLLEALPAR